jgi:3-oxoacyl-[acyl-carrier protein] reductase
MKRSLENEVALITGGTSGIGKAIALKFAQEGAKIAIIGTNPEKGKNAVDEIQREVQDLAEIRFYSVDVALTQPVGQTVKKVLEDFGHVDILVNNAGITIDQLMMKMSEQEWDQVLDINLKSCYNTCHALVRPMMKAKRGKIINISSAIGLIGNPGQVNYAASKAGMIGFTKALAKELAPRNIQVNCIAPGFIHSNMTDVLSDGQKEFILKGIPLGYMGNPVDIANTAWFLSTSLSSYITGQVIAVDGGMVM